MTQATLVLAWAKELLAMGSHGMATYLEEAWESEGVQCMMFRSRSMVVASEKAALKRDLRLESLTMRIQCPARPGGAPVARAGPAGLSSSGQC